MLFWLKSRRRSSSTDAQPDAEPIKQIETQLIHQLPKSNELFVCGSPSNLGFYSGSTEIKEEHGSDDGGSDLKDSILIPTQYPRNHIFRNAHEVISIACGASHTVFLTGLQMSINQFKFKRIDAFLQAVATNTDNVDSKKEIMFYASLQK
jgi:hypothetical protein